MDPLNQPPSNYQPARSDAGKAAAIIAYFGLIGLIIAFVLNSNEKTPLGSYHIRQSLGLQIAVFVCYIALAVIWVLPVIRYINFALWPLVGIAGLILWVFGLIAAINGELKPIPVIGQFIQDKLQGVG